jgi:transcriptional regulator GlxA family with amidase domain
MAFVPPARHLLRAKNLADARFQEPLGVDDLARPAGLSRAHFSREFRRAFGEPPHAYLLTRRLERAAALLRATDRSVATSFGEWSRLRQTGGAQIDTPPSHAPSTRPAAMRRAATATCP